MYRGLTQFCCASETQSIAFAGNIAWSLTNTMLVIWSSQESTVLQGSSVFFAGIFLFLVAGMSHQCSIAPCWLGWGQMSAVIDIAADISTYPQICS